MKGYIAWNQTPDGSWMENPIYNRSKPFFVAKKCVRFWRFHSPAKDSYEEGQEILNWMTAMHEAKDWREVQNDRIDRLSEIADELFRYGIWHMSKEGGTQPNGSKKPYTPLAGTFLRASADMERCITICRLRMEETQTVAMKRSIERRQLSLAVDAAESERRMAEFEKKKAGNGE